MKHSIMMTLQFPKIETQKTNNKKKLKTNQKLKDEPGLSRYLLT